MTPILPADEPEPCAWLRWRRVGGSSHYGACDKPSTALMVGPGPRRGLRLAARLCPDHVDAAKLQGWTEREPES